MGGGGGLKHQNCVWCSGAAAKLSLVGLCIYAQKAAHTSVTQAGNTLFDLELVSKPINKN